MNDLQCLIDRQYGIYCRLNYDNILKRLVVDSEESFYGLQNSNIEAGFDQDPPIFACRFSEAPGYEHILALANEDGRVAIQNTRTLASASTLEGFQCHNNAVFDLAWMPQNKSFVTVSGDHTACLWDVAEGSPKRVLVFSSHTRSVKTAVFRPTEPSVFATGARDGHILVWDIRAYNQPSVVLKPDHCLMSCHSSFNPKTPGSHGKRARLDSYRAISITGLVFQDELTLISCGECDGNIKVWDLRKNYSIYTREPLPKHSIPYCGSSTRNGYTNLVVDEARTRMYASCMDNVIYCFNVSTYGALPERRYVGHENATFYIKTCLSPDGAYLVSGSSDKHAYVWNVSASQPVVRLAGHRAEVTCAAWCRAGDTKLVTCSDDARHKIWRVGPEHLADVATPRGRAELVPRAAAAPHWGALDKTPNSLKRKGTPGSHGAKRARTHASASGRNSKRSLTDLMNASRDDADLSVKRPRLYTVDEEPRLLPSGIKRPLERSDDEGGPSTAAEDWYCAPGASLATPVKRARSREPSPGAMKSLSPNTLHVRSPVSPGEVRVPSFTTPTKNLPDFVFGGEAPHQRLMSPGRKREPPTDWLTRFARERRGRCGELLDKCSDQPPLSPKENVPVRRNSVTDKTPKQNKKSRTLLKYFSVTVKQK